jgi:type I restriction enzyme S subunit
MAIVVPPMEEQRAIVEILDSVDDRIRSTERLIAKLYEIQDGALLHFVKEGLQQATWLSLDQLTDSTMLGTVVRGVKGDGVPLIKMGNLRWGALDLDRYESVDRGLLGRALSALKLEPQDLLLNTRNTPDLVGKTAVWDGQLRDAVTDNNILRIRFSTQVNTHWACCYMTRAEGRRRITGLAVGTTSVAAIYWRDLRKLMLPLPPLDYQERLEAMWLESDRRIARERAVLAKLQQLRRALMDDLLTGRVRVNAEEGAAE